MVPIAGHRQSLPYGSRLAGIIAAGGYEMLITHLFVDGDQYLDSDAVFGVKKSLIRTYTRQDPPMSGRTHFLRRAGAARGW
jgi:hypothetical protein